jgi:hypothetical protein
MFSTLKLSLSHLSVCVFARVCTSRARHCNCHFPHAQMSTAGDAAGGVFRSKPEEKLATAKAELATAEEKLATAEEKLATAEEKLATARTSGAGDDIKRAERACLRAEKGVESAQTLIDFYVNQLTSISSSTGAAPALAPPHFAPLSTNTSSSICCPLC